MVLLIEFKKNDVPIRDPSINANRQDKNYVEFHKMIHILYILKNKLRYMKHLYLDFQE